MLIRFVAKSDRLIYFQGMEMRGFPASCLSFNGFSPMTRRARPISNICAGPRVLFAPIAAIRKSPIGS